MTTLECFTAKQQQQYLLFFCRLQNFSPWSRALFDMWFENNKQFDIYWSNAYWQSLCINNSDITEKLRVREPNIYIYSYHWPSALNLLLTAEKFYKSMATVIFKRNAHQQHYIEINKQRVKCFFYYLSHCAFSFRNNKLNSSLRMLQRKLNTYTELATF